MKKKKPMNEKWSSWSPELKRNKVCGLVVGGKIPSFSILLSLLLEDALLGKHLYQNGQEISGNHLMHIRKWGQGELMRFCYCGKGRDKGIVAKLAFVQKRRRGFSPTRIVGVIPLPTSKRQWSEATCTWLECVKCLQRQNSW